MHALIGNDIEKAKQFLVNGDVVAIPTETVYGLAANALNSEAVVKIFEAKNRPRFNPLIVHCSSWKEAQRYVKNIPAKAQLLAGMFTPGPLTFLLDKKDCIPDIVTAGSSKVAIRIPNHPVALRLLDMLDFPLAAPSANTFGYISPTSAQHVFEGLYNKIPYILDGHTPPVGVESTIIGFDENEQVMLHRHGGISIEQMEKVTGGKVVIDNLHKNIPVTSGQMPSHYAPDTPLFMGNVHQLLQLHNGKKIAVLSFFKHYDAPEITHQFTLSHTASLAEAAKNLFAVLRLIDQLQADVIIAEFFPDEGIGRAINDRLQRAGVERKV